MLPIYADFADLPSLPRSRSHLIGREVLIFTSLRGFASLRRALSARLGRNKTVYVGDRVAQYRALWSGAADAIGAEFLALTSDVWEIRSATRRTRVANDLVQFDDPVILDLAGDKTYCYMLADHLGLPTPDPKTVGRDELGKMWRRIPLDGGPYVVKPAKGTGSGVGVSVGVKSRLDLANALALASLHARRVIVERLVAAETVRLLFLDGVMIHAVRRRGVRVIGDGASTIGDLLARPQPRPVPVDAFVRETIRQQGRSLDEVLPAGTEVVARWLPAQVLASRELRTIYDEDVTQLVAPTLVSEVARFVAELGSRFAAIDVLTNDPTRTLAESDGVFLEVNTTPALHHHCTPSMSRGSCAVAELVLKRLLDLDVP